MNFDPKPGRRNGNLGQDSNRFLRRLPRMFGDKARHNSSRAAPPAGRRNAAGAAYSFSAWTKNMEPMPQNGLYIAMPLDIAMPLAQPAVIAGGGMSGRASAPAKTAAAGLVPRRPDGIYVTGFAMAFTGGVMSKAQPWPGDMLMKGRIRLTWHRKSRE